VRTVQNQADQGHDPHDQTQNNHNAQSVGFGFLLVIDGNDGVQQMINVTSIDLAYDKLHTTFPAQIKPSRAVQTMAF
jgi:hypothetical protein